MLRIAILGRIREEGLALLRARPNIAIELLEDPSPEAVSRAVTAADAVVVRTARIPPEAVERASRLRVISRHGVGYDNVPLEVLNRRRIPLAITASANRISVAEHAFFLMLALAKRGREHDRAVRAGNWGLRERFAAIELWGKRLLLLGFGRIGSEVARRAIAFGMKVAAYDPWRPVDELVAAGVEPVADLASALGEADIVSLHMPHTPDAPPVIGARELARMRPSAFLVNTARGGLVDEAALVDALRSGRLAGAGLDVFAEEPPPPDHPLLALENVVLSPHAAGSTREATLRMATESVRNVLDVLDGRLDPAVIVNYREIAAAGEEA
ncbi:Hydroxypyruvate reductase [bacterium HR40]|nr:Hydroxypyruvate reductase [bacterium HR40]